MEKMNRGVENMVDIEKVIRLGFSVIGVVLIGAVVAVGIYGLSWFYKHMILTVFITFCLSVLIVSALTYFIIFILKQTEILGSKSSDWQTILKAMICENDFYPSLSRAQFLMWTFTVAIVFLWIILIEFLFSYINYNTLNVDKLGIPDNLLLLLGMASGVAILSKSLSNYKYKGVQVQSNKLQPLSTMFMESGKPSITRYQMFIWTIISIFTYFTLVLVNIRNNYTHIADIIIPDCPTFLLGLMGVSQLTYVGGKFTSRTSSSISEIVREKNNKYTILGINFEDKKGSVLIKYLNDKSEIVEEKVIDGNDIELWEASKIKLTIPNVMESNNYEIRVQNESGISYPCKIDIVTL